MSTTLVAVEGNAEFKINGKKSRSWLGEGNPFTMLTDRRCYNIALAATAKRGTNAGLSAAVEIFDSMPDPSLTNPLLEKLAKNLVTFIMMINAFANAGLYINVDGVFEE